VIDWIRRLFDERRHELAGTTPRTIKPLAAPGPEGDGHLELRTPKEGSGRFPRPSQVSYPPSTGTSPTPFVCA
jgi:hypothetical protein